MLQRRHRRSAHAHANLRLCAHPKPPHTDASVVSGVLMHYRGRRCVVARCGVVARGIMRLAYAADAAKPLMRMHCLAWWRGRRRSLRQSLYVRCLQTKSTSGIAHATPSPHNRVLKIVRFDSKKNYGIWPLTVPGQSLISSKSVAAALILLYNHPMDREANITPDDFSTDFRLPSRPVIITDAMDSWPARTLWDRDYLRIACGADFVTVMTERSGAYRRNRPRFQADLPFADMVDIAFGPPSDDIYMVANSKFFGRPAGQRLLQDIPTPEYIDPGPFRDDKYMWLGPADTVMPLHFDTCDLLLCQVFGTKRFWMFAPDQTEFLYHGHEVFSDVDPEAADLEQFPLFAQARCDEFELHAGEMLFIPKGHWHHVRSLAPSATVSFARFKGAADLA
jgi:hypothetical protein